MYYASATSTSLCPVIYVFTRDGQGFQREGMALTRPVEVSEYKIEKFCVCIHSSGLQRIIFTLQIGTWQFCILSHPHPENG